MPEASTHLRIPPLEPPYEPEIETLLKKWMPPGAPSEPLRLFRTLAVHDELASRMRPLGAGILGHGRVEPRAHVRWMTISRSRGSTRPWPRMPAPSGRIREAISS